MKKKAMTLTDLGKQLGITKGQASKLSTRGMPVDNVEAAQQWRRKNLDPAWMKPPTGGRSGSFTDVHDPVGKVLRLVLGYDLCKPALIALVSIDAGLALDGAQALRLAETLLENYMRIVDAILADEGQYSIDDELLTAVDSDERRLVVEKLDALLLEFTPQVDTSAR